MVVIREETPADFGGIRDVTGEAFGGDVEVRLIDLLRAEEAVIVSLVAVDAEGIVGHILFSGIRLETTDRIIEGASLAPVSVRPGRQRQGVGSALIRRGLDICRERSIPFVAVLGYPDYYRHFGFSTAVAERLHSEYSGEAWMAIEIVPGSLNGVEGSVVFPHAFQDVTAS